MSEKLQQEYNGFKTLIQELEVKIQELSADSEEHRVVLESLERVDGDRNCKRMIGTVLVDKKVREVIPALKETRAGLEKALETLRDDLNKTYEQMGDWKKKHNVKVVTS